MFSDSNFSSHILLFACTFREACDLKRLTPPIFQFLDEIRLGLLKLNPLKVVSVLTKSVYLRSFNRYSVAVCLHIPMEKEL